MNDDFNTPILIAKMFDAVRTINLINDGKETITKDNLEKLMKEFRAFLYDVLGMPLSENKTNNRLEPVMDLVLDLRQNARDNKDWTTSDKIRDGLASAGIVVKDGKEGTIWQ
jgi:cysteinyl-tRNA synthetase